QPDCLLPESPVEHELAWHIGRQRERFSLLPVNRVPALDGLCRTVHAAHEQQQIFESACVDLYRSRITQADELLTRARLCLENRVNPAIPFEKLEVVGTVHAADGHNLFPHIR